MTFEEIEACLWERHCEGASFRSGAWRYSYTPWNFIDVITGMPPEYIARNMFSTGLAYKRYRQDRLEQFGY